MSILKSSEFTGISRVYRAKRLGDRQGEWVEGWYVRGEYVEENCVKHTHYMYSDNLDMVMTGRVPVYDSIVEVDEYTVRVFTGIFGYQATRLWEGDILILNNKIYTIRYLSRMGCFCLVDARHPNNGDYNVYFNNLTLPEIMSIKVVGNDVDDSINDVLKKFDSLSILYEDKSIKGYFVEQMESTGGKVFTLYNTDDVRVGEYKVGDDRIYELCLNDMGYVCYDEYIRMRMEKESVDNNKKISNRLYYMGYKGEIIFDKESRLLHGKLVDIKDLVTFEGQDSEEIERAFHEAVEDYIEMRLDLQGGKTV